MATADIIAAIENGTTITKKVGKGKKKVEMKVTRTEPTAVKVVDETVQEKAKHTGGRPVDEGKVKTEILPGLSLIKYTRGYFILEQKGRNYSGQKTVLRRIMYKDCIDAAIRELVKAYDQALTYEEAHAGEATAITEGGE
jgi:hypothetical protein